MKKRKTDEMDIDTTSSRSNSEPKQNGEPVANSVKRARHKLGEGGNYNDYGCAKTSMGNSARFSMKPTTGNDLVASSLERAKDELGEDFWSKDDNLDSIIRSTQSLVDANSALLDRFKKHVVPPRSYLTIERILFEKVRTDTSLGNIEIKTKPKAQTKKFAVLQIPHALTNIIPPPVNCTCSSIPDYQKYLQMSLRLNDRILKQFLSSFRGHLEKVHCNFQEIVEWLNVSGSNLSFLSDLFENDDLEVVGRSAMVLASMKRDRYVTGAMNCTFDITHEIGREKLKKFLLFLK
eukprot:CAMPEP_0197237304 /NCGR_PEP_ID=MMETSP1429-20130617/4169_1 /TAXON_ID=49237 /ORGANISM="Chaetoceros  sp., Strain UNC1202" /LENGTH=291 /DNA_ID=CAMNT_0042696277 /DNA_START=28 /DNA_END=903 /DNA_ORIENTATION=+